MNESLEDRLHALDERAWHFERNLLMCSVPIPFVLFGPTGVFLLQGSRGFWSDGDIVVMSRAACTLRYNLPDYPDLVHPAIVILDDELERREHFGGGGDGPCWILGDAWLVAWLRSFGDRGLSEGDIAFLRDESDPARVREWRRLFTPLGRG